MNPNLIVLFTDVHNFSRVMLEFKDRASLGFLDEMYRRLGEGLVSQGGRIIKYLGDALLAVFGETDVSRPAPPLDRSALAAVQAAAAMRASYARLVEPLALRTETDLEVGIAAGECEVGIVGHETLRSFDVFGECVNEAAMIGHHRGIAVTGTVRDLLADDASVSFTRLPDQQVKWREQPLELWEAVI
jgi:adenylate cyclase